MAKTAAVAGGALSGAAAGASMGPYGALAGGIIGGGAALLGGDGSEMTEEQMQLLRQMQKEVDAIPLPSVEAQKIVLEKYKSAGVLTPQMENVFTLAPSAMEQVKVDPRLKEAQMGALSKLQQLGQESFTAEDRAAMNQLSRQTAQQEAARQASIIQNLQQRGIGGGGAEIASRMSSSQAAAERQSEEANRLAQQAQARALQAIMQSGTLGGSIRGQEYGEQSDLAKARDVVSKYNVGAQQAAEGTNVSARNAAQEFNLRNQQQIMNQNTQLANEQEKYNKALLQRQFENQLSKARAKSGTSSDLSSALGQQAAAERQATGQLVGGVTSAIGAGGQYFKAKSAEDLQTEKEKKALAGFNPQTRLSTSDYEQS